MYYTDVEIPILLAGTAGALPPAESRGLGLADQERGLERRLVGLDFSGRLLRVEVIHGLGDLAAYSRVRS